jgi:glycosyltransferase involved in cell wall biosynthesis
LKILLLNTDDFTGGAAIACRRLLKALQKANVSATMLVQASKSGDKGVIQLNNSWISKQLAFVRFVAERLYFLFYEKSKVVRFSFNPGKFGLDISKNQLVKNADILHLHWINFGFLSIDSIQKLGATQKPIVWTLHDMWAFTGGCHHSGTCENYQNSCGNCKKFLKNPSDSDLSSQIWNEKMEKFANCKLTIVTCSRWLGERAAKSSLFRHQNIISIPNPIDINLFRPIDKKIAKSKLSLNQSKKYILFASMSIDSPMKGYDYFKKAIEFFTNVNNVDNNLELLIFGKANVSDFSDWPLQVNYLGQLSDFEQIINVYNAASVFVIPSLEENLPNTIMEALACGTPVVGFDVGGIPEMIDHKQNGYLAKYKSAEALADGINYVLNEANYELLSHNARQKVVENYAEEVVVKQYEALYKSLLK